MVINKLQAALGAVTNEATVVAGAQINLDFTLIKNEAPKESQALGAFLSPNRKEEAEGGQLHVTARRLGALVRRHCPTNSQSCPSLWRARLSDIEADN
jgi:hypothetical protein